MSVHAFESSEVSSKLRHLLPYTLNPVSLLQELRAAPAPAVRNNIMVALADLCVQVRLKTLDPVEQTAKYYLIYIKN